MEDTYSRVDEFNQLVTALDEFLATYAHVCLDEEEECRDVANGLAHWMMRDRAQPRRRARSRVSLNVVDEVAEEHIIRLTLDRTREMSDSDFLQSQNFFWSTIGRAIRDNPELIRTLRSKGVSVETNLSCDSGEQSHIS